MTIQGERGDVVVVHDGRHLPQETALSKSSATLQVEIDAHLAFGTGNHETTRMMVGALLDADLNGKRVLDCGCGTGILGIVALKRGCREVVGYDIDEWSADNARHNAVINQVDSCYTSLLGDASVLETVEGTFDVVLANINRNILLNDMAAFRKKMNSHATLLLSGFYAADIPLLEEKATSLGLHVTNRRQEGDWTCLAFEL